MLPEGCWITFTSTAGLPSAGGREEGEGLAGAGAATRLPALGRHYYGDDDCDLAALVLERLAERSRGGGATLAVAESCTGGGVAEAAAGSSADIDRAVAARRPRRGSQHHAVESVAGVRGAPSM